jgi:hypothetical protein
MKTLSSDGVLARDTRLAIWAFDVALLFCGWIAIKSKNLCSTEARARRRFIHAYPGTAALLLGLFLSVFMIVFAELIFYGLNRYHSQSESVFEGGWAKRTAETAVSFQTVPQIEGSAVEDPVLGYKPPADAVITQIKRNGEWIIYDAVYRTDEYNRRRIPLENPNKRDKFLAFFGDSITFGQGVNDEETLPYYLGRYAPEYKPYNYGVIGYGPQNMLAKLQSSDLTQEISEKNGIGIYTFVEDHIFRTVGVMHVVNTWGSALPYYTFDESGGLVRKGDFTSGRPLLSLLYRILGKSQIIEYFKIDFPPKITDTDIKLTARIIEESRNLFKAQFPEADFLVLFFPIYYDKKTYVDELTPYFERAGIKYLDYSTMKWPVDEYTIKGDFHPTPKGHHAVAARLTRDLGISKPRE